MLFRAADRDRTVDRLLALADEDPRIVAGAVVGSAADGRSDRWSDVDLTFGVRRGTTVQDVLSDWTTAVSDDFEGAPLFDVTVGQTIYRVFLLPGSLQVDLSFSPADEFGATGPRFRLLFGTAVTKAYVEQPSVGELFGLGVHHAVRARLSLERARWSQAEYWTTGARHQALALACRHRGLDPWHGHGFDQLPPDLRAKSDAALVRSADRDGLRRALHATVDLLTLVAGHAGTLDSRVRARLEEICGPA